MSGYIIHLYMYVCQQTYVFKILYFKNFQMPGISVFIRKQISRNIENLKFCSVHISLIAEILEIWKYLVQEIQKSRNCATLFNNSLVSTFIFGQICTGKMALFIFFCQFCVTLFNNSLVSTFIFGQICTGKMALFIFFCQFSKTATLDFISEACIFEDEASEITWRCTFATTLTQEIFGKLPSIIC